MSAIDLSPFALLASGMTADDASRYGLALVCLLSAVLAAFMAQAGRPSILTPHLFFIAGWSIAFALGMISLATVGPTFPLLVEGLNTSAALVVGGWTHLVYRLRRLP